MISLAGNFFLWLSLFLSLSQFIIFNKKKLFILSFFDKNLTKYILICIIISFCSLTYSHIISDFSLLNVFQNSHTTKPLIYKITAVWGNHEGSMLLWVLVLSIFNYFLFKFCNKINFKLIYKALETQAFILIGFLLFTLITSNPFVKIFPVPNDGQGFNPLLQDPALAIHPPLLYIGYVGLSAAFSLGVATLSVSSTERLNWYNYMKPFVLGAWTFLTIGIALGSIWAYYELGWGGWWFWDPVENASLMPWLLATALIHSLITVEKIKSLQTWVLLLSILAFLLSVIGTFLVRSGILTSVHAFALDPERGFYILSFIAVLGTYSLLLYGFKSKNFISKKNLSFFTKEGSILFNNILMVIVCSLVFLGTLYPLIIEVISKNKISVGEPYFNSTVIPFIVPAILIMGIGPLLSWNNKNLKKTYKKIFPSIFITLITTAIFIWIYNSINILGIIGIGLSSWIISNVSIDFFKQLITKDKKYLIKNIFNSSLGMTISHFGVGLMILGITASSVWQKENIIRMKLDESTTIHNYQITFKNISEVIGPNYIALQGNFDIFDNKKKRIIKLNPENRFYPVSNSSTTEASIHTNLLRDLYMVMGDGDLNKGWVIRIYYNPLVIWIWIGVFVIFIGGIFTTIKNVKISKKLLK